MSSKALWDVIKILKPFIGLICGGVLGLAGGVLAAMGLGMWSQWENPHDPSAGAVAIIVIVTAPAGASLGAVLGYFLIQKQPKLFLVTLLPASLLLLFWTGREETLHETDRPRRYRLEVVGSSGTKFVGLLAVDGNVHRLEGTVPKKVEYEAMQVEIAVAPPVSGYTNNISVKVFADEKEVKLSPGDSHSGVYIKLKSRGSSDQHGGTASYWHVCASRK